MANSKNVLEATDSNFQSDVVSGAGLALVDFWAEWCGPCRMLGPTIEAIADSYAGKMRVYKMNVDHNPGTPSQFSIRGIPTLLFFKDGKMVDQLVGNHGRETIENVIKKHL